MAELLPGITVIIPTFKRVADLARCLAAIETQLLPPSAILITYRGEDDETGAYLACSDRPAREARLILCAKPGVVYALNAAIDAVQTEFFAITDDDAIPHPDWLQRIMAHFAADPQIAGVGGKDNVYVEGQRMEGAEPVVGKVLWYGRVVGHHHLGVGPARPVDTLKGVNLAFRTSAFSGLRLDSRLRGKGAQVGWEMGLTLALRAQGQTLIYDPQVLVEHFPGERPIEENRAFFNPTSHADEVFNRTLIVMEYLGTQRFAVLRQTALLAYQALRGTRKFPGLLTLAAGILTRYPYAWARFRATVNAQLDALNAIRARPTTRVRNS